MAPLRHRFGSTFFLSEAFAIPCRKNSNAFPEGIMHVSVSDIQGLRESFIQLGFTNIMSWVRGDWGMVSFH